MIKIRALAPLAEPNFRRIWSASLLSNLGQLVLGVAAAWQMTRLTNSPEMVALVQSALMLPLMLVAVPAGAVADMFDRRKIAMSGLVFSALAAGLLTALSFVGMAGPWVLLAFCFLIGAGVALYSPSWQASIPEQVSAEHLPSAIALGSVSYNIARSFGPALGGMLVVTLGATPVFGLTAIFYLPLLIAFFLWNRRHVPPRLPPERLDRAIISGIRYALHAIPVRTVMIRSASYGAAAAAVTALTPLIARDLLHGNAGTYGILLGAGGVGAVCGAVFVSEIRERVSTDRALDACVVIAAIAVAVVAFSHSLALTTLVLLVLGAANMVFISLLNVAMQLSVPRWVTARALAWFTSSLTGGIALGAWMWGSIAGSIGVSHAVAASAVMLLALPLLSRILPLRDIGRDNLDAVDVRSEPDVALAISGRSGPIAIEIDYRVNRDRARGFYDAMLQLQRVRKRNGGFGWALSRDIADPSLWTERFEFPTWQDYLRNRERFTEADLALQTQVATLCEPGEKPQVRRRLERPFGSVRWKAETPDPAGGLNIYAS
ncbi:MFS family permease [Novosphingobium hassiacum]|uniref:MFS family permease n=1 Tax=Novosphingobium hassiacum TaxID=173676 RepID=A0A7W5ZZA9_9SPHN|nr:MFS transporter [Novosphingobium hassiacum]MBB3861052.1 MFS family permease [Novosphingobium hassiacum]